MKKGLLIIDRGSKMKEVQQELFDTCSKIKAKTDYYYVDYCFLEVLPPFIGDGIKKCIENGVDSITVVPYFLYPGMKLKDAVSQTAKFSKNPDTKVVITKPLSYQPVISKIVLDRLNFVMNQKKGYSRNNNSSILLIGHGSSDRRARDAFLYTIDYLKTLFKNVNYCFLELEYPDIEEGIAHCISSNPDSIFVIPYFLHKGIHIQKDIIIEIDKALKKYNFKNLYISDHIGVDPLIIDLIINLSKEAEIHSGLFKH
ncbi:MAG: sirohydrochlorin cobaltochelatase [Thermoproteota archaeon]|nr:sirohydrochlorin cobaltochelatase [Thermoproteota archaeon]